MNKVAAKPVFTHLTWISILAVFIISYLLYGDVRSGSGQAELGIFIITIAVADLSGLIFCIPAIVRREGLAFLRWTLFAILMLPMVFVAANIFNL